MTREENIEEAGRQAQYEIMRAENCGHYIPCGYSEFSCCKLLGGESVHEEVWCPTDFRECPLFTKTSTRPAEEPKE